MEKFKRILVHEDLEHYQKIINQFDKYLPLLKNVQEHFEALEMEKFSNEVYQDLLKNGFKNIEKRYNDFINAELDKIGTNLKIVRDSISSTSKHSFTLFKNSVTSLKAIKTAPNDALRNIPTLPLNLISYGNKSGYFYITENEENIIKEKFCRAYIENERQKQMYDAVLNMTESYNNILDLTKTEIKNSVGFKGLESVIRLIHDPILLKYHPNKTKQFKTAEIIPEQLASFVKHSSIN